MKKLFGLFAAPLVAVSMLCSCGGANVKVENDIDSLNYAFGYANGNGIRQYVIGDTMPKTEIDKFKDGFKETFKNLDAAKRLKYEGMRFATSFGIDVNNGFLLRDSAFVLNKDLMMSYFDKGLRNQVIEFSSSQAEGFVQKIMFANMEGTAPTPEQIDTVNMAYGFVNGRGVRTYMLKGDTTAADINSFMKGLNEGLEMDMESNKIFLEGTRIGLAFYDQLTNSPGLLNDADIPVNLDLIKKALMFGLDNDSTVLMTMDEADQYIQTYMDNKKKAEAQKALEEKKITYKQNIEDGEAFLADNATKEGVSVTESGLQYKVEKMGKGAKPTATDKVKVHYHGTLIDGTVFDSSVERGESIEFPLNGVIAGWTEGLQLMPVGSKFTFYIPYDLAYGDRNTGSITPFSTLIFDVELIDIVK